jgi:very-long-chain enoyl-CoA reductase
MVVLVYKGRTATVASPKGSNTEDLTREAHRLSGVAEPRIRLYIRRGGDSLLLEPQESVAPDAEVAVVDSGPQVSPAVDNLLEYGPPIPLWILTVVLASPGFGEYVQLTMLMWVLHFAKRVFEVLFVHTFSRRSLPIFSITGNSALKNCLYYWAFSVTMALNMAAAARGDTAARAEVREAGLALWCVSEILNGYCHLALKKLRPKGSLGHFCPKGFLFNRIIAPNYTFEILAWVGYAMFSQTLVSVVFPIVGGAQMWLWADEKRRKLSARFPAAAGRGRLLPFL